MKGCYQESEKTSYRMGRKIVHYHVSDKGLIAKYIKSLCNSTTKRQPSLKMDRRESKCGGTGPLFYLENANQNHNEILPSKLDVMKELARCGKRGALYIGSRNVKW